MTSEAPESLTGKWSYSTDGEVYHSAHLTKAQAIAAGSWYDGPYYVGQCVDPIPPEDLFTEHDVENWIDGSVRCHDDYAGEWAEDAMRTTGKQREELAAEIRPLIAAWLDRHKLRPTFWNIDPMTVEEVQA